MSKILPLGVFLALSLFLPGVTAQEEESAAVVTSAHGVVRGATMEVMAVVQEAHTYADEDPERYYQQVLAVLDPVVDFRGFARSVMGPYASSERYRSLDEGGRAQLRNQLDMFTEVMRTGLVRTYSKGLLAFGGSRIEVSETSPDEAAQSRVSVQQLIYSDASDPYMVLYQMGRDKKGQWKLRNMIIESVNLGEIYRSQFEAAARQYEGDLDQVIADWNTEALET
ncbi:MAG: ABC transporter substrate-binding protein [Halieaceae bacterium]